MCIVYAGVAKLEDAPDLGSGVLCDVWVRLPPPVRAPRVTWCFLAVAQFGSVSVLGTEGRGFESRQPDNKVTPKWEHYDILPCVQSDAREYFFGTYSNNTTTVLHKESTI